VNGVVDLFQRGTTAAGGSKLGKAVGMGQDIVLFMLTMLKMF
jgi:ribosomal protein L27